MLPTAALAQPAQTSTTTAELPRAEKLPDPPQKTEKGQPATDPTQIEEIEVTTERRTQSLQDVAAVTKAVDGDDLRLQGINSFTDLSNALPQLNIGNREGNVEVFIRGIGDDNNTELSEPRSAILLDGVYISRPRGLGSFFFDIERVELNIGPQGTLRGRNATGGSLNIISAPPELGETGGYVDMGVGNFSRRQFEGAVNIPLGEDVALRLAGYYLAHSSMIDNVGPLDIDESRQTEDAAFRASIKWQPTNRLSFTVTGDFLDSKGTGYGGLDFFPYFQSQFPDTATRLQARQQIEDLDNPYQTVSQGSQPEQAQQIWGIRGVGRYSFDDFSVEYIGAFRSVDFFFNRSASDAFFPGFEDFYGINFPFQTSDTETFEFLDTYSRVQFDQLFQSQIHEVRIYANEDQRFRWTAGAFFFQETGFSFFNTTADRGSVFAGVEFAFPDVRRENFAFYGDATFDITTELRVTAGIRYTNESLERSGFGASHLFLFPTETTGDDPDTFNFSCCQSQRFGSDQFRFAGRNREVSTTDVAIASENLGDDPTQEQLIRRAEARARLFRAGIAQFGKQDDIDDQIELLLSEEGRGQTGFGVGDRIISSITPNNAARRDVFVNWRARIEFDPYKDGLLYAGMSTGTNSGGFNDAVQIGTGANARIISPEFDKESVLVAEVGTKNKFSIGQYQGILN
ncbi:MAG: TonB-dependent receptor plug domain-containing protein, partial [Myxococcota bacterium]